MMLIPGSGFIPASCGTCFTVPDDSSAASIVLLMHMDGADNGTTFTDQKGKTFTRFGNAVTDTDNKKFGTAALLLPDDTSYISTPANADFDFGSGAFTIEAQVYPTTLGGGYNHHVIIGTADNDNAVSAWVLAVTTGGGVRFSYVYGGTPTWDFSSVTADGLVKKDHWNHVSVSCDSSGNIYLHVNGCLRYQGTRLGAIRNTSQPICVGRDQHTIFIKRFIGSMDELRVTKGVARYTKHFCTPDRAFANP